MAAIIAVPATPGAPALPVEPSTPRLSAAEGLTRLATYAYQILTWVDDAGYPVSVATNAAVDAPAGTARIPAPAGLAVPIDREVSLTGSHIRPQPGYGYDERRHVTVWGHVVASEGVGEGAVLTLLGERAWGWDEAEVPFFEYSERSVGQSRRYFDQLAQERGTPVRPRLALPWLVLRTTRLPFLTATVIPVLAGIFVAAVAGSFTWWMALLTIVGAAAVHLGLNVTNDIFDTRSGADDLNVNPTQFSGGSRVLQYGLVSMSQMSRLALGFYTIAAVVGLILLAASWSPALLAIGLIGFVVSVGYTAPPLKFVYRGLGELAVFLGFGPLMTLGAFVVQSGGTISAEAVVVSIPIGLLVAMILYINEIPDRRADARAGKRTLPVRWSKATVIGAYDTVVAVAFGVVVVGVAAGILPVPTLLALLAAPLAVRVHRGVVAQYDYPYGLMAPMGLNVKLHTYAGGLLLLGYVIVLVASVVVPSVSLYLHLFG
jgi:1,4-dihydroxy-2-naphthoate octaprenyltransferase